MARMRIVPIRMSLTGYARSRILVELLDSHTDFRPNAQAVDVRARPTMSPSNHTRQREDVPRGALQNARMPPMAKGTAARKPASANDGYGVGTLRPTSQMDHTTSPADHSPAEMPISVQPIRSL